MSKVHTTRGDGHIIFHVGSSVPAEGSSVLLVPGVQTSQGRGVYCAETPDIRYAGGEFRGMINNNLPEIPIYCVPMSGGWVKAKSSLRKTVYNSKKKIIYLENVHLNRQEINGTDLCYIVPSRVVFYYEPQLPYEGKVSLDIIQGKISHEEALRLLHTPEKIVSTEEINEALVHAFEANRIPFRPNQEGLKSEGETLDQQLNPPSEYIEGPSLSRMG